ncbi:adenosine receptor A2b [Dermacentor albipictus]|uniref:adenosine receptor A2b n=1 Tax=Dermacentor albipictus TaxID=60249 RepID=UPI0038FCC7D0
MTHWQAPPVLYTSVEASVAFLATVGNLAVLVCFARERRLRRRLTNYYILSLAVADLLVGVMAIPFAVLTRAGIPHDSPLACVAMLSFIVVLCTVSILHLVAVSVDRYWAILYPLAYQRLASEGVVLSVVIACWLSGFVLGFLPLLGWHDSEAASSGDCLFLPVMKYSFLVFLYFATIVYPALLIAFFYIRIYSVVRKQLRQITVFADNVRTEHDGTPSRGAGNNSRSDEALCTVPLKETPDLSEVDRCRRLSADFHKRNPRPSPTSPKSNGIVYTEENDHESIVNLNGTHHKMKMEAKRNDDPAPDVGDNGVALRNGHVEEFGHYKRNRRKSSDSHHQGRRMHRCNSDCSHCFPLHLHHHHSQQHKREVRTAKALLSIVLFFMICWFPLYTLNCIKAFCVGCEAPHWVFDVLIVLSHANSALNPFLYAYRMSDFRNAFKRLLRCKSPAPLFEVLLFYRNAAGTPPVHRDSGGGPGQRPAVEEASTPVL